MLKMLNVIDSMTARKSYTKLQSHKSHIQLKGDHMKPDLYEATLKDHIMNPKIRVELYFLINFH